MARVREPERTHIVCSMPKMYSHQCSLLLLPLANWPVLPVEYRSTLMQALSPCAEYVNYHPTPASNRTYRECAMHGAIIFPQSAILPCKPPGFICGAARNIAGPSGPFRIESTTQLLQGIPNHVGSKTTGTLHIDMARVLPRSIRRPRFLLAPYPSRTCGDLDYKLQLELEWLELKRDY